VKAVFFAPDPHEGAWASLVAQCAQEYLRAFDELGVRVQVVEQRQLARDPAAGLLAIERFAPDFVTAVTFNYLLLAASADDRLLHLDVPTVARWDDPLGALANRFNYPAAGGTRKRPGLATTVWSGLRDWLRGRPDGSRPAPPEFRDLTRNPRLLHFPWDSGHAAAFLALGLAAPRQLHWYPVSTYAPYYQMGESARNVTPTTDVAFCGNIYLHAVRQSAYWQDPFFRDLIGRLASRKARDLGASPWDLLLDEVGRLPDEARRRLGLFTDRREFWQLYLFAVWSALNTLTRLEVLGGLRKEVSLFGLFADPDSRALLSEYPNLMFAGNLDNFTELPRQYAATKINVCLSNSLIYRGTPSKLIDCLASGGFALCDPKDDLVRLFGRKVEAIFCRSAEEFNDKIDYFLGRPGARAEIVHELRRDVVERCSLRSFFGEVLKVVRSGSARRETA